MAYEIKKPSKPRQVRGTTAYKYRNWFVFGIFAASGLSWLLFEWVFYDNIIHLIWLIPSLIIINIIMNNMSKVTWELMDQLIIFYNWHPTFVLSIVRAEDDNIVGELTLLY